DEQGAPLPADYRLQQKDLARTYRRLAAEGPDYFYRGDFARQTAQWMKAHGGLITFADFANYKIHLREPVVFTFAGHTLYGFPPPSSGGTHVAQILNILENFDLDMLTLEDRYHLVAEAMKFAFADRAHWLGDPDFSPVPAGLTNKHYAQQIASRIDLAQVTKNITHGNPDVDVEALMNKHTTHIATADMEGNWVAITSTVNTSFGSKVVIPGTGVVLNNQMDDFSIQPGVANAFGLVGSEANSVQSRKRPLSSMSPTLVLKDGQPVMTLGAAGGPTIVSQVLLTLLHTLHYQLSPQEAVALPRIHQQWSPNRLYVESAMPETIQRALREKGHDLQLWPSMGATQLIELR